MGKMKNFLMEVQEQMSDAGARFLVVYSVELDPSKAVMEEYRFKSGARYFFSCFSDCEADVENDVVADLLDRTGCFDEENNELPLSVAGVNEESILIVQVINMMES